MILVKAWNAYWKIYLPIHEDYIPAVILTKAIVFPVLYPVYVKYLWKEEKSRKLIDKEKKRV